MKKKLHSLKILLTVFFSVLQLNAFAQKTYKLITSTADLSAGSKYIILDTNIASTQGSAIGIANNTSRAEAFPLTVVNTAGVMSVTTTPATNNIDAGKAFEFTLGGTTGAWTWFDPVNNGYLAAGSSAQNQLRTLATSSNWTISFNTGAASLTSLNVTGRNILRYNNSSAIFSCYQSGVQSPVYLFKEVPAVPCSGTPTGGTVIVSPTSGVSGSTYGVTATGYSTNSGLTYQWRYSDDGVTYINYGSATSSYTALSGLNAPAIGTVRRWKLVVTCTASSTSADSSVGTFTTTYCSSVPSSNDGAGISGVKVGSTTFSVSDVTYYNYNTQNPTPTVPDITQGFPVASSVTFQTGYSYDTHIWIDFNDDGVFNNTNEKVYSGMSLATTPTTLDTSFILAAGATTGQHQMRIGSADAGQATPNPCYSGTFGVTIDLLVNVVAPPPCTAFASTIYIGGAATTAGSLYPSLTAAIADLSRCGITQPTTLSLNASYVSTAEIFPIVIPSITGSSAANTITIKPATGVTKTISGASTNVLIQSDGGSHLIIDGSNAVNGTSRDLTLTNTSALSGGVVLIGSPNTTPVSNVTLKNTIINNGTNTTSAVIISSSITPGNAGYFNNITVKNNSISKAYIGLYANANTAANNGDGLLITGNDLVATGANSIRLVGLYVQGVDGNATVSNNNIANISNNSGESPVGIWLATATNRTAVNNNVISGVASTVSGTYTAFGIYISSGNTTASNNIYHNTVSGISSSGAYIDGSVGIEIAGATPNVSIYGNKISNIKNNYATGNGAAGVFLGSSSVTANTSVYNNMIWDIAGTGNASVFANGHGLFLYSGAGYKIYYNSVNMTTNQTRGVGSALYLSDNITAVGAVDLRNNIFANNQTANSRYAIYSAATKTVLGNIDFNDYYSTGVLGYSGGDQVSLADWQTATGKDTNSLNVNPPFISSTDLHLSACSSLESAGTPVVGITTDIDGDARSSTPDIGADEFSGTVPLKIVSVTGGSTCGAGTVTLGATGAPGTTQYLWYASAAGGTPLATTLTGTFTTPSISATTTYYVAASNGSCNGDHLKPVVATVNPAPTAVSLTATSFPASPASSCELDYVKLDAAGGLISNLDVIRLTFENGLNDEVSGMWTTANNSTGGNSSQRAAADWSVQNNSYVYGGVTFNSSDTSKFGITNSDATGTNAVSTNTELVSPSFSLVGYSSASLNFHHYYRHFNGTAKVQISTDGGATWTAADLASYNATSGTSTLFSSVTINLASYLNQSNVKIRFKYAANFSWYWAIDNIKVSGNRQLITWSPTTGLYTDASLSTPIGSGNYSTVYASPETAQTYTATSAVGSCSKFATSASIFTDKKTFTGAVSNRWNVPANWLRGSVPTADKCVIIPAGKAAVVNVPDAVAKTVTVDSGGSLTIGANQTLKVTDVFTNLNASNVIPSTNPKQYYVTVESDGSLLQTNNVTNAGAIAARREITIKDNQQYNYLISPLIGSNLKTDVYENQTTHVLSSAPFTLYYNEANNYFYSSSGAYIPGRGLAVKEPAGVTGKINALFTGVPMNGPLTYTLANTGTAVTGYNLIGNPYPSNIDLDLFYNLGANSNRMSATFCFWDNTANTETAQQGSGYSGAAYAVFNAAAGSAGTGLAAGSLSGSVTGSKEPTRVVKPGQGFMVRSISTVDKTIDFSNAIRIPDAGDVFFGKSEKGDTEDDRFYLKFAAPTQITTQAAVVYFANGNSGFAHDDSEMNGAPSDILYTLIGDIKAVINGRAPFVNTDVIPLGTKHFAAGSYRISLGKKEGVFANGQAIYLKDKNTGTITNLSEGDYTFGASAGESTGRFEIMYQPETVLATDAALKEEIQVYRDGTDFVVKAKSRKITDLQVYDASGRLIFRTQPNSVKTVIDAAALANGMYLIQINQNGEVTSRKVLK
ncbi:hypothetical protein CBW16_08360 [Flavobacteriaceae bacterium JJC]|nr:hypothetical protein CBW16_08360 [Flavobacteriaceae bacterium JJC]